MGIGGWVDRPRIGDTVTLRNRKSGEVVMVLGPREVLFGLDIHQSGVAMGDWQSQYGPRFREIYFKACVAIGDNQVWVETKEIASIDNSRSVAIVGNNES